MSTAMPRVEPGEMMQMRPSARIVLICAAIVILPFHSGSTSPLGLAISEALLCGLLIVAAAGIRVRAEGALALSRLDGVGLVFIIAAAFSALFSVYPIDAWRGFGALVLIAFAGRICLDAAFADSRYDRFIMAALLAAGLVQAFIGFHEFLFSGWYQEHMPEFFAANLLPNQRGGVQRIVGGFINPNYFAGLLNLCFGVALASLLFGAQRLWMRLLSAGVMIVFLAAIVLSGSKGGLIATALIAIVLLVKRQRLLIWAAIALLLLVALVPNPVRDTVVRGVAADPYVLMRPGIWLESLRMAANHPLAGVGPSNFHFVAHAYIPPTDFLLVRHSHIPNIAHNAYLQGLAEFGIAGFLPLLLLLGLLVAILCRVLRSREPEDAGWPLRLGLAAGVAGLLVHSLVDNLIANRAILLIMIFALAPLVRWVAFDPAAGKLHRCLRRDRAIGIAPLLQPTGLVAGALLLVWFFAVQVWLPLHYEQRMQELRPALAAASEAVAPAAPGLLDVQEELLELSRWYPDNLALCRSLGQIERTLFLRSGDARHFSNAVAWFGRAESQLHGRSAGDAFSALALHFDLIGRGYPKTPELLERMRALAGRAIAAWPNRAIYEHFAAMIEREAGDYAAARSHAERAVALEPNFLAGYVELERISTANGDESGARRARSQFDAARKRIQQGPPPERDDAYAWQIIAPAR